MSASGGGSWKQFRANEGDMTEIEPRLNAAEAAQALSPTGQVSPRCIADAMRAKALKFLSVQTGELLGLVMKILRIKTELDPAIFKPIYWTVKMKSGFKCSNRYPSNHCYCTKIV